MEYSCSILLASISFQYIEALRDNGTASSNGTTTSKGTVKYFGVNYEHFEFCFLMALCQKSQIPNPFADPFLWILTCRFVVHCSQYIWVTGHL